MKVIFATFVSFLIAVPTVIAQGLLQTAPVDGAIGLNPICVRLEWVDSEPADSFYVFVSEEPIDLASASPIVTTFPYYFTDRLNVASTYYWKVRSFRTNGDTTESQVYLFSTKTLNGDLAVGIPTEHGVIHDGIGYFQAVDGKSVFAFDIDTYATLYSYPFNGIYDVAPLILKRKDGSRIIVEHERNTNSLVARFLDDGQQVWRSQRALENKWGLALNYYVRLNGEILILVPHARGLTAVSAETGAIKWQVPARSEYYGNMPGVDQKRGYVYFISDSFVQKISAETGTILAGSEAPKPSRAAGHGNTLVVDDEFGYYVAALWWEGGYVVYDSTLKPVWEARTPYIQRLTALTYHNGVLYVPYSAGWLPEEYEPRMDDDWKYVVAHDIQTGTQLWKSSLQDLDYANIHEVVYVNGKLLCNTDNVLYERNRLYLRLSAETGEIEEVYDYGMPVSDCASPVISFGRFYEDGIPMQIGVGEKTDWQLQFGSDVRNHTVADAKAVTEFGYFSVLPSIASEGISSPRATSIITEGMRFQARWHLSGTNEVIVEFSTDRGATWIPLSHNQQNNPSDITSAYFFAPWAVSDECLLRIREEGMFKSIQSALFSLRPSALEFSGTIVNFDVNSLEDSLITQIFLWTNEGSPVTIYRIRSSSQEYSATYMPVEEDGIMRRDSVAILIKFLGSTAPTHIDTIRIYTNFGLVRIILNPAITLVAGEEPLVPERFELLQNYPNPFNPSTVIAFSLPSASYVKLTVFDMLGREVRRLVDDEVEAGSHAVVWDGTDASGSPVSAGVYYCTLMTRWGAKSSKMVFLK